MRVADYIMSFVAGQGVRQVFLLPGGGAMHLVDALGQHPDLEYLPMHHEQACSIAAEACSRVTGNLGVALVTTGPGATNAITGVAGAWIESVPLLLISGQVKRADMMGDSGVRQMGVQEVDIVSMVRPVTKYAVTVEAPERIRFHLEKAVALARRGRKGPVWLDVPLDVQAAQVDPQALAGYDDAGPVQLSDAAGLARQIEETLRLLDNARRPLILAGHGVRLAGAADSFLRLAEGLGVPVVATWNAMDLLHHDHPLFVGKPGVVALRAPNFALQNCDLLIAIGSRLDNVLTAYNFKGLSREAVKVVVDIDAHELAKFPAVPDLAIVADAGTFIKGLLARIGGIARIDRTDWLSWCRDKKRRYRVVDGQGFPERGEIGHFHFMDTLSDEIPEDMLVVTGSSGLAIEAFYTAFRNKRGQRVFLTSGLGAMGYGLPAAIGACVAAGKNRMVALESDGSLQLNMQELATLKGLELPILLFVLNNRGYASIRNTQRTYFEGRYVATGPEAKLHLPDLRALAQGYGIASMRIEEAGEMRHQIREALERKGPFICEVMLKPDETLWPKVAAIPQADGSMTSMPLEDMSPLLPLEVLEAEMMVPLSDASLRCRR